MIVHSAFKFDGNDLLKSVQHELYMAQAPKLFQGARARLIEADAILCAELLVTERARAIAAFDHRVLHDAHDIIAAVYRYRFDDGGQLDLLQPGNLRARYESGWTAWFEQEVQALCTVPTFVRSCIQCVVFANSEFAYMSERALCEMLTNHYCFENWVHPEGYLQSYKVVRA